MDENKEVISTDPKREKVRVIPLSAIDDAPDHPFGVRDDEEMAELVESISTFGVINPVIVRKGEGERYELISGHRRKFACSKLGIETLPVIVRDLSREEAIIFMVDSNLQREHILPSERAKAYKMKMLGWNLKAVTWMRSEKFWTRLLKVLSVMPSIKGKQKQRRVSDESCDLLHLKRSKGQEKLMLFRICKPIVRVSL